MKLLDRFSVRKQAVILVMLTVMYGAVLGPYLISADNTILVILGFTLALMLLFLWFSFVEKHFNWSDLPDNPPIENPPNTHPAPNYEEALQEARDAMRVDEPEPEVDVNDDLTSAPAESAVDPATLDGPNAPGTVQVTPRGTREW